MNRTARLAVTIASAAALLAGCDRPSELPDMKVLASAITFDAGSSGDPAPQTIQVVNAGQGTLAPPTAEIAYQEGTGWLTAEVQGAGAPYAVALQARTASLPPGTYRATLTLACANAGGAPVPVPVTLTVPGPSYALATTALAFDAPSAGDPPAQTLQVENGGRGTLPVPEVDVLYAGTSGATTGWLTAAVSGTSEPYTVTVTAREVAGMPSGIHQATLIVGSAVLGGRRQAVPVRFTLAPQLVVTASLARFSPAPVDAGPLAQTFTVRNVGRGVLPPPLATATSDGGWLSAKVEGTAEPYTVVVTAERYRALLAAEYVGTVAVSSPGAPGAPAVDVSLHVAPPVMNAVGAVAWSVYGGCPLPGTQSVTVTNTGVGFLPKPAVTIPAEAASWLGAEVTGAQAPYEVVFTALAPPPGSGGGSVSTSVTLAAPGANAVQVPVSFASPPPAITGTRATPSPIVIHAQAGTGDPAPAVLSVRTDGGCVPTPTVTYAYAPAEPAWLSWKVSTTPQRHDVSLQASTAGMSPGGVRNLSLYVASSAAGSNTPVFSQHVPLTLENAAIEPTGAMSIARAGHALVALPDGRALVTGGWSNVPPITSPPMGNMTPLALAEVYDPVRRAFAPYPSLVQARNGHGAVALEDGRVVVCGGASTAVGWGDAPADVLTCEVSAGGPWTILGTLRQGHLSPTLVPLPGGRLLVVSRRASWSREPVPDAEVVELSTGTSTLATTADAAERVQGSTAVRLADGSILVAGGPGGRCWRYDPATDQWRRTGDMNVEWISAGLVPLPDGRVLALTGRAEIWDPRTGAWSSTGSPKYSYARGGVAGLAGGKVVAFNGEVRLDFTGPEIELFDPATGTWSIVQGASLPPTTLYARSVTLASGQILIVGGTAESPIPRAEAFTW